MNIKNNRLACMDVHSPLYLRSNESRFCGGDIGDIYRLVDRAAEAGFGLMQFTPLQDTGINPCPYMGVSIFSYNPIHLSLDHLPTKIDWKLLDQELINKSLGHKLDHVAYRSLYHLKMQILRQIYTAAEEAKIDLKKFSRQELAYAIFKVLKGKFRQRWTKWPEFFRQANLSEIIEKYPSLLPEIKFQLFVQNTMRKQWLEVSEYARRRGIEFLLDKPIYPVHDSAEVWANQELFYLRKSGELRYGSGCDNPRDPFGSQYWGHAVYKFKEYPKEVTAYFLEAIEYMSSVASNIRLDHTLALIWKYYLADPRSKKGHHRPAIKGKLFNKLISKFPDIQFIAEDLGYVSTRYVDQPLARFGLPGMRSLQWFHIPKYANVRQYPENCLAMTSNHDLDSLPSWWRKLRLDRRKIFWRQMDRPPAEKFEDQVWQLVELLFNSKARIASISLRDIAFDMRRYNKPGSKYSYNWTNREHVKFEKIDFSQLTQIIKSSLRSNLRTEEK